MVASLDPGALRLRPRSAVTCCADVRRRHRRVRWPDATASDAIPEQSVEWDGPDGDETGEVTRGVVERPGQPAGACRRRDLRDERCSELDQRRPPRVPRVSAREAEADRRQALARALEDVAPRADGVGLHDLEANV